MSLSANIVAPILADFRKRLRMSQAEFAAFVGYPQASSLQRYCQHNHPRSYLPWHIVGRLSKIVGKGEPPITEAEVQRLGMPRLVTGTDANDTQPKMGVLRVTYPDADVTVSIDADEIVSLPFADFNKLLRRVK